MSRLKLKLQEIKLHYTARLKYSMIQIRKQNIYIYIIKEIACSDASFVATSDSIYYIFN